MYQGLGVGDRLGPGLADGDGDGDGGEVLVGPADGLPVGETLGEAVGVAETAVKKARWFCVTLQVYFPSAEVKLTATSTTRFKALGWRGI